MMRVIPEKHTFFWNEPHQVCFSGMNLIMHAFLGRPSSCMLFWNDPHHVCFSGMTLIMLHDEGLSRKACMMRVIPEKHTY
jgi:hypothetical protein